MTEDVTFPSRLDDQRRDVIKAPDDVSARYAECPVWGRCAGRSFPGAARPMTWGRRARRIDQQAVKKEAAHR
jgi:hypothetical protein